MRRASKPKRASCCGGASEGDKSERCRSVPEAQVAVLDGHGTIIFANEPWERAARAHCCCCVAGAHSGIKYLTLLGRSAAGRTLRDGIHEVLENKGDCFCREFACCSSTEEQWFEFTVTRLAAPARGVVVCRLDVTREKIGDAARARLAAIVESSTDAITAAALDGTVTSWNAGAEKLYGFRAEEMLGKPIGLIVPGNRRHELAEIRQRLLRAEAIPPIETYRKRKDGKLIPVALTLFTIKNAKGEPVGTSGIARDISDRRKLEMEVLRAAEREQRRIAEDLHDGLAQHLSGICCLADVLEQQLTAEKAKQAEAAKKVSGLLCEATSQARRLAHGLYPVPPEPRGLMSALSALANRTHDLFDVSSTFLCPAPVLVSDSHAANHLYRIAQEAVTNALRHGHPKKIDIVLMSNRAQLVLGVRDDGEGFRPKRRKGIGIRIMNYRAHLLAGTLVVQRIPSGGTEVLCTVDRRTYEQGVVP